MTTTNLERTIASHLLNIQAVALRPQEPFTWTSGIKSPIYCDNRLTMSYPDIRAAIAEGFASLVKEYASDAEVIAGTATAGIPHAAWVADKLGLPMAYIRDKAKGHGKQNQIEGIIRPGQKVVVIEDLISTGGSSLKAALAVKEAGAEPLAVFAIFSYQLDKAVSAFAEAGIPLRTLSNYSALIDTALELGVIQASDLDVLKAWRRDPASWSN
ncbi:orotate phosphoribosyltransferase [Paenibacillus apiarius]|uniref:Orotate phosphoribosyltransferase n=1 Tax=Paenibacillus apiarius TaxID=46240 RepID=A0ABT4DLD8_9BACL|nr:orotate phosphoribosyltransferase [Paenibacillus apiarius]MCY9513615.1 orotate phosphoribosyltransferase [Paenibacillus apiarius]MCY9518166.1 orotate phosphoribosyltransferase [Paenibacillus apiarius]MCY9551433.1 orotate phosphoribosyltransferase [Paenibacillus apiarius]MCY9558587.1 orotate phosphoribosyltransferase [Paenibacillus apiarius]MCY9684099.1 orotate phosphoribosyltransferase [Paenibacillus apiarius]